MATITTQYKRVQENVLDSAHKIFLAGLGTVKTVGDEGGELFGRMVERGKDLEAQGKKGLRSWRKEIEKTTSRVEGRVDRLGEQIDGQLTSALHRLGVPTRDEIKTLTRRVEELSRKVDKIAVAPAAPRKAPAPKKIAAAAKAPEAVKAAEAVPAKF